jgi:hypothetical protein
LPEADGDQDALDQEGRLPVPAPAVTTIFVSKSVVARNRAA